MPEKKKFVAKRSPEQIELGQELRKRISDAGYTLTQLGTLTGLGRSCIWRLTAGQPPTPEQSKKIEEALRPR